MPEKNVPTPDEALGALLALRRKMLATRKSLDGTVHAPPTDAELVLEATGECLAELVQRVAALETTR